jgi:thiol-disulfide isomerase/thioredoxin
MGKVNTKTAGNYSRKKRMGLSKTMKGGKNKKKGKKGNKGNKKRTYKKPENRMKQIETMWDTIFQRNPEPEMEGMDMKREIVPINKKPTGSKNDNQKPVVILLHAEWCGHCKTLEPEWKRMKNELDKKTIENIIFEEIESADLNDKLPIVSKNYLNGVPLEHRGFPTIGSIRNNQFEQYGGQRTADSLLEWVRGLVA